MRALLKMTAITKEFVGVVANKDVDLVLNECEILGLIGENGAGKSTLMNILYGLVHYDSGKIEINEREVRIDSPFKAIELGIGMIHQHFMLVPSFTVLQNIILGREPKKLGVVNYDEARRKVEEILKAYSLSLDLDTRVRHLSVGQMQVTEIVKQLYRGAKILIMDEPTAVLTPGEISDLFHIMRRLREGGCSIIFITHKLKEVMRITDRVEIMRRGVVTGCRDIGEVTEDELAFLMIGRRLDDRLEREERVDQSLAMRVRKLCVKSDKGHTAVDKLSFRLYAGEILGIAGVEGNGQTELVEALTGLRQIASGKIQLKDCDVQNASVRARREKGMSHIPENRIKSGVAKQCTIKDNLILDSYYRAPRSKHGVLCEKNNAAYAERLIQQYAIKVPDAEYLAGTLSGGNMQKVILAREMDANPDILIAAQPTRGVDIGAISFIYDNLIKLRNAGKAVLLVSAELDEILKLSDRIIVMYEGKVAGTFKNGTISENELGLFMTGAKWQEAKYED